MSWAGAASSGYSPSVARKPTAGALHNNSTSSMSSMGSSSAMGLSLATASSSSQLSGSAATGGVGGASSSSSVTGESDAASGPVRTTDQANGDLVVPLVIWNDPPRVQVACLHVLYLPMSQPSQNSSDLMNRWPSLASVMQQWSSSQLLASPSSGSLASLRGLGNSAHSMINLRRVLSRQKSKRASLTPDERMPLSGKLQSTSDGTNGNGGTSSDFMDDEDFQYVDDGDLDCDDELYQLCVFAGTLDGNIVYWLFEQDVVVQVSMLVHPTTASVAADYQEELEYGGSTQSQAATPVVGIVSGIDEWGQSNMISVSQDGAIARWELPNGACSRADVNLARQLAPVKGMEMFCNNRYAIVYGEQSRMMVLDTWKLALLYCVDTAQEQSTSLKDGDNMNPQTALMRSIKSSYFPRRLHVSSDASLLLVIWDAKWVILKRKWLCDVSPPGTTTEVRGAGRSASWKDVTSSSSKTKPSKYVGSCRVHPAEFVGRQFPKTEDTSRAANAGVSQVWWEDGAFLDDNQVVLWTNTGHVFQFPVSGTAFSQAGKLFMFTKDKDQLVPRSFHKTLNAVEKGEFVAFVHQCECCQGNRTFVSRDRFQLSNEANHQQGYTSCVFAAEGGGASRSFLSSLSGGVKLVHMCAKGSVGSWTLSPAKPAGSAPPSPTRRRSISSSIGNFERVKLHSISDGFVSDQPQSLASSSEQDAKIVDKRAIVTHLILGREGARSSSFLDEGQFGLRRRRRKRSGNVEASAESSGSGVAVGSTGGASNMIVNALSPVSALLPTSIRRQRRGSIGGGAVSSDDVFSDFLLDVPVVARGCSDGSIDFKLLASARPASSVTNSFDCVRLNCHREKVRAIAHCYWPTASTGQQSRDPSSGPPSIVRTTTTGSSPDAGKTGVYMSARKALVAKRGAPIEDSCLASDKNPFFRARFPPPVQRRSASSRHLNLHQQSAPSLTIPPPAPSSSQTLSEPSSASLNFVVFSGCADGVLCISELTLQSAENSSFALEVIQLQRFKKHRGAIKEVLISPWTREYSVCPERYVATIGDDNTVNVYAPVYLQNPYSYGAASSTPTSNSRASRIGVEWECVMEFCEHPDSIRSLEWFTERGQICVECEDGIVYVWSLDTGVLERSIPAAVVYGGGNVNLDEEISKDEEVNDSSVECSKLIVGDTLLHLIKFNVNKSADVIKTNWKAYYFGQLGGDALSMRENSDGVKPRLPFSSPYAVGSIELLLLAFLLSWGASPDIDRACRQLLGLDAPNSLFSCVLLDESSGALSIPLPWKSVFSPMSSNEAEDRNPFARKWQHSSALSANVALGIVSLCMNLMEHKYTKADDALDQSTPSSPKNKEEFHVLWSQLITQHSVVLPDYVPFFREPSLEFLANYGFHPCEYTQLAARALMNSAIKRLHPPTRSALSAEYSAKLHCEIVRVETETGGKLNGTTSSNNVDTSLTVNRLGSLVILLSMIGTCYPGEISPAGAREVCDILVSLLRSPVQHVASVAAELLTKGLMLFRPHLVDLSSLITQLLFIDLREKQRNPGGESPTFGSNARVLASGGSNAALSLLVELGACETAFVLTLLQHEMNNADRPHAFRECILLYLTELINSHYLLMFRHLSSVIDTIMHCLDPTKPERRKRCLELSTRCLHNLVRRFPMVDFHKETQRLAIGTMEAVILIYDLRTATKWRVLDGHSSAISAVSFRADGQILVSYAAREGSVRWWNSGNAGLFGGMLKLQQSCIKEHKLDVLKSFANAPLSSGGASGDLKQVIQTCKFQFLVLKEGPNNQQGPSGSTGERKVLRLTREDASQVQFLM